MTQKSVPRFELFLEQVTCLFIDSLIEEAFSNMVCPGKMGECSQLSLGGAEGWTNLEPSGPGHGGLDLKTNGFYVPS